MAEADRPASRVSQVRQVREMRGLSGSELARRAGYHPSLVSKVERGHIAPWPAFRERIAAALQVDEELLFGRTQGAIATQKLLTNGRHVPEGR